MNISVLDTTLRDGAQAEGIAFSLDDKIAVAALLDELGVAYIEAGNPASNPKDAALFAHFQAHPLARAKLVAFGSTCRPGVRAQESPALLSLLESHTPCVSVFGKAWDFHVREVLHTSLEENLRMVRDSVAYLVDHGASFLFDAGAFFDGDLLLPVESPWEFLDAPAAARPRILLDKCDHQRQMATPYAGIAVAQIGYAHGADRSDRPGSASIATTTAGWRCQHRFCAVRASVRARHVQGTINGYGERCGNCNLCTALPTLALKMGYDCIDGPLAHLTATAASVAELANLSPDDHQPYVGRATFAHKGGMHVDGVRKAPQSFEHIDPALVGNERRFLLSEMSGRAVVLEKLRHIAPEIADDENQASHLLAQLKQLEYRGYQFDVAEASFELLVLRHLGKLPTFFKVLDFKVISANPQDEMSASAMIKVEVGGQVEMTAAEGNGPVDALDRALRKALSVFYPCIGEMTLTDF
jgi:2-isopropylmalate synthase